MAAGVTVANLYYAQPLAPTIARDLHASVASVSSALVGSQLGYAAGMLLLVPLGDIRERRATITITALACGLALLGFAAAPSVAILTLASFAVGMSASVTQMLVPFAVSLAAPENRGQVVGTVMGGLLAGVLLSRSVSGALGAWTGWRAVFLMAAALMGCLALALRVLLPRFTPATSMSYPALLRSLITIVRREPVLRARCLSGAFGFASFSVFWSTIAYQVASPAIGRGSATAGMLGIIGITGVIVAPIAGRLAMKDRPTRVNIAALALVMLSFVVFLLSPASLIVIGVGVVLLDAGVQGNQLANQTVIFGISPDERSRFNAIYMVAYFLGGALGTAAAAQAWERGGWSAVCVTGLVFAVLAFLPLARRSGETATRA